MGRAVFETRCARLEQLRPDLSQTSGVRSQRRNDAVGGSGKSRHLGPGHGQRWHGARDYVADGMPWDPIAQSARISELELQIKTIGLFGQVHGEGHNQHLHVQSAAPLGWDWSRDGW